MAGKKAAPPIDRGILVQRAKAEIMLKVFDMAEERGLTRLELTRILAEEVYHRIADDLKEQRKQRRKRS
jgi:hypothetical protein